MNRRTRPFWACATLALAAASAMALLCAPPGAAAPTHAASATDSQQAKTKLAAVRARIAELARRRARELAERDALSAHLRDAELEVTAKRQALEELQATEAATAQRRAELLAERQRTQAALDGERSALAAQVRMAAMLGPQREIKLLLNQSDARRLGRMLTLEGYFGRARAAQIGAIDAQLTQLNSLTVQIEAQSARVQALATDVSRELEELLKARAARAALLATLASQVRSADQELAALKRQEQAVESLLADLADVLQDFPTDPEQSFAALRGRLPWPVTGRLTAAYHDLRADSAQGGLRWNGVMIEAAKGAKVRAPYFGRVIYADWLQGLGLLMIISHSGGYLSLYGHAEVLYKAVGDWVSPGDLIAALPDSGAASAQLYFEIRQGRKPVDPKLWLK
ncbi:MAG: murein hydrolase activator EnvC family protein [Steroidobacterales bacterium]